MWNQKAGSNLHIDIITSLVFCIWQSTYIATTEYRLNRSGKNPENNYFVVFHYKRKSYFLAPDSVDNDNQLQKYARQ